MSARRPVLVLVEEFRIDEAEAEIRALLAEDLDHARELLRLTRAAMRQLARGQSPATTLDELERVVLRLTYQRKAASAALAGDELCPDGAEIRHLGHGAAA